MGSHLEATVKACGKCLDEAKKLEKQLKAAKPGPEKDKIKKMAEACRKMAKLYFDGIDTAKAKDVNEIDGIFKNMGM